MYKNINIRQGQEDSRNHKIIVERHYAGTEKMETVFRRIAEEQITKRSRK